MLTVLAVPTAPIPDALLDAIQPRVIIVADSGFPATERAKPALHERLEARDVSVFYTRNASAVTITIKPKGWELRTPDGLKLSARLTFEAHCSRRDGFTSQRLDQSPEHA